ncbi:hypothetical protein TNCV_2214341 [Trichonephila clavipes]|nr:hypothetical protein TNCV_2214341 [Trichonephila clavipes]
MAHSGSLPQINLGVQGETQGRSPQVQCYYHSIIVPPNLERHYFTCRNCGGGDRGRVAIYRPFGEFHRA